MKKRIYAILLTAIFIVGVMAAVASAEAKISYQTPLDGKNTSTPAEDLEKGNVTVDLTETPIYVGQLIPLSLDFSAGNAKFINSKDFKAGNSGITVTESGSSGNVRRYTILGKTAGSSTIVMTSMDNATSKDKTFTVKVKVADGKFYWSGYSNKETLDLGTLWDTDNKVFMVGQSVDISFDVSMDVFNGANNKGTEFKGSISPATSGLSVIATPVAITGGGTNDGVWVKAGVATNWTSADHASHRRIQISGDLTGTKDQTYTLKLEATNGAGKKETHTYTFTVWANPTITVTNPPAITWGDPSWAGFTPTIANYDGVQIAGSDDKNAALKEGSGLLYIASATSLKNSADIAFDSKTGAFSLANKTTGWKPGRNNDFVISKDWKGDDIEKIVRLYVSRGKGTKAVATSADFTLTFKGVAPAFEKTADGYGAQLKKAGFTFSKDISYTKSEDFVITAYGPGMITFTSEDVPEGIVLEMSGDVPATDLKSFSRSVIVKGKPTTTANGDLSFTLTATSSADKGDVTITVPLYIGTDAVSFDLEELDAQNQEKWNSVLPSGDAKVDDSFELELVALPGPITWSSSNLPAGITLTPDTDDTTKATLSGTYTAARASQTHKDKNYSITATNAYNTGKKATISADLMVWTAPVFPTTSPFGKKDEISTGTKLNIKIPVANFPDPTSWDIKINDTQIVSPKADGSGTDFITVGEMDNDKKGYVVLGRNDAKATSFISFDIQALSKDKAIVIVGSTDRVPSGGEALTLTIKAQNYAGATDQEYSIKVNGVAPVLPKDSISLTGKKTSKTTKVTKGDPDIDFTATIDAKTAKKVFDTEEEIDLTKEDNKTGIIVSFDVTGKISFDLMESAVSGEKNASTSVAKVAYSKMPVTITANNPDISDKIVSAKFNVDVAGNAPELYAEGVADYKTTLKETEANGEKKLPASFTVTVQGNVALENPIGVYAEGAGPLDYTIKPTSKNGLEAAVVENDDGAKYVAITGTPVAEKKDVSTKFSVTVKNPSTGKQAKVDITVLAKPTPAVAATELTSTVLFGKASKIAPKATVSNTGMKWVVDSVKRGETTGTTEKAATTTTEVKDALKDIGLTFDDTKGTITGTSKYATGSAEDDAITITMHASGDISTSDIITAKLYVLGEKVKLTTKNLSVNIDGSETSSGSNLVSTSVAKAADTRAAMEPVTSEGESNYFYAALADVEEVAVMTFALGENSNTYVLGGTPSKPTKKATVNVTMDNYGTKTTGKLSIAVVGNAPTIEGDNSLTLGQNETGELTLTIGNPTEINSKVKWSATKPSKSGVTAKVKGDATGATVTVKAAKKATGGETTFTVTATDSVTKKVSDKFEITVTVEEAEDSDAAAPETYATTPETYEEKVALGEGEVKMGAQRTVAGLSAATRTFIEEQGYVIAAVLPQIEVTADGQYDFEVDLDEEVAAGAELVWFAFASKPTTDDEIVDFADEEGNETKVVPASHVVIVTPWLNAGTKYAPVIAVKAAAGDAEATTVEEVKEAAEAKAE